MKFNGMGGNAKRSFTFIGRVVEVGLEGKNGNALMLEGMSGKMKGKQVLMSLADVDSDKRPEIVKKGIKSSKGVLGVGAPFAFEGATFVSGKDDEQIEMEARWPTKLHNDTTIVPLSILSTGGERGVFRALYPQNGVVGEYTLEDRQGAYEAISQAVAAAATDPAKTPFVYAISHQRGENGSEDTTELTQIRLNKKDEDGKYVALSEAELEEQVRKAVSTLSVGGNIVAVPSGFLNVSQYVREKNDQTPRLAITSFGVPLSNGEYEDDNGEKHAVVNRLEASAAKNVLELYGKDMPGYALFNRLKGQVERCLKAQQEAAAAAGSEAVPSAPATEQEAAAPVDNDDPFAGMDEDNPFDEESGPAPR